MMTELFKKLNFKQHQSVLALNSPPSFKSELAKMKEHTSILTNETEMEHTDFIIAFPTTLEEIEKFGSIANNKGTGDFIFWLCYPKGTSKEYKCNFNRDTGFNVLGDFGFEGVRQVAIDHNWSALRFRKVEYIKTITRSKTMALTEEAKSRTTKQD